MQKQSRMCASRKEGMRVERDQKLLLVEVFSHKKEHQEEMPPLPTSRFKWSSAPTSPGIVADFVHVVALVLYRKKWILF